MKYLAKDDVEASHHQHRHRAAAATAAGAGSTFSRNPTSTPSRLPSHRSSRYDTSAHSSTLAPQTHMSYRNYHPNHYNKDHNLGLSLPAATYGYGPATMTPGAVEPLAFSMFVQQMLRDREPVQIHTFTKSRRVRQEEQQQQQQGPRLPDLVIEGSDGVEEWCRMFPPLSALCDSSSAAPSLVGGADRLGSVPVIFCKASLEVTPAPVPRDAELGIRFEFAEGSFGFGGRGDAEGDSRGGMGGECWSRFSCQSMFFEEGVLVAEDRKRVEYLGGGRLGNVPFGSFFWAHKIVELTQVLREAASLRRKRREQGRAGEGRGAEGQQQQRGEAEDKSPQEKEDEVREKLERLAAVQDISAVPSGEDEGRRQRLAMVCWKFELAPPGQAGETTWRNLLLPGVHDQQGQQQQHQQVKMEQHSQRDHEDPFGSLPAGMANDLLPNVSHGFDQAGFEDLGDLSNIGMSMNDLAAAPTGLGMENYSNGVDFTGGHIQICMNTGSGHADGMDDCHDMGQPDIGQHAIGSQSMGFEHLQTDPQLEQADAQQWPEYSGFWDSGVYAGQSFGGVGAGAQANGEGAMTEETLLGSPLDGLRRDGTDNGL